ncbi:MAG: LPS export ABC transporter ATP-binding protein [Chlamydiae bacterium]|jgi:lipopolysaccharide export system ATP-binding protein|nr:LPS export ABC transporter ATP-binding protein [Chlamydiota bacterium]
MEKVVLLECKHLQKTYGEKVALKNVSFHINEGEIVGLLGHNGAGKTTAFYTTIGLIQPDEGKIIYQKKEITHLPIHKRAKLGIGYLSQEPSIFRSLTVEENLLCILETLDLTKEEIKNRLETHLNEMHLTSLRKKKAYLLSGGEKRRVEIARTLIRNPKLILLDEPFANIDPKTISDLKKMIVMLKDRGISILITDHNAREIFSLAERSYLISSGEVLAEGSTADLIQSDSVRHSYLGQDFIL